MNNTETNTILTSEQETTQMEQLETSMTTLDLDDSVTLAELPDMDTSFPSMNPVNSDFEEDIDAEACSGITDTHLCYNSDTNEESTNTEKDLETGLMEEEDIDEDGFNLFDLLNDESDIPDGPSSFILEVEKRDLCNLKDVYFDVGDNDNHEEKIPETEHNLLSLLEFSVYKPPSLLCRHPPPETGRDDDEAKLKEILDNILIKSGNTEQYKDGQYRILFAPDHKIGKNLLSLMSKSDKYQRFLPEFPILHLRKSRICNIFSGYKHAGLIHILKYMRDDHSNDWSKLLSERCIDDATAVIWRITLSLHLSFLLKFCIYLPKDQIKQFLHDMDKKNHPSILESWDKKFEDFLQKGSAENATFGLHVEMMTHCDEVLAIALSERLGGKDGYDLLLGAIKSSLPFAFLNGATSYASYTTSLLHEHFRAGVFHQNMKMCLFTTPHKFSCVNFGLDSQREMDHKDVVKGFRSGSSLKSIIPRMSLIDELNEAHETRRHIENKTEDSLTHTLPFSSISNADLKHIVPTVEMILKRNGLNMEPNIIPYNVYAKKKVVLSTAVLDMSTYEIGQYLIKKYVAMEGLFGQTKGNLPDLKDVYGPAQLIRRVQKMKGTVINRMKFKAATEDKTDKEIAEEKRMKKVERIHKNIKCLSSNMNACQAIVKPDCSKPKVMKASGIQQALTSLLLHLLSTNESIDWNKLSLETPKEIHFEQLSNASLMWLKNRDVPLEVKSSVRFITVEFAGAKFKCKVPSGSGYLNYVESSIIKPLLSTFPLSNRIIICEEKYSFTPDDFKAATREQRKKTSVSSIAHLKTGDDIISSSTFVKEAIVSTQEGKIQISTFLAKNAQKLNIKNNITIDFDSEFHLSGCICKDAQSKCSCNTFAVPLRCFYLEETGYSHSVLLHHIKQRKGEAEMSQVDWLIENISNLKDGEAVLSVVTSGDIDAIVIHMFALPYLWPRNEAGKFQHPVYVMLQKPGKIFDLYNITNILELLETKFEEVNVGIKIALILCLGGNDFLPKFYSISHKKILETILKTTCLKDKLITIIQNETFEINIDKELYKELIKTLYCPKKTKAADFSFEEVRKMTVLRTKGNKNDATKSTTRNAQLWMPPLSAIEQLHRLIQCQIKYLLTVGHPEAQMPNFLQEGCLKKTENGEIEYDLGPDAFIGDVDTMFNLPPEKPFRTTKGKRKQKETPQKGSRRKLPMTSTPRKQ